MSYWKERLLRLFDRKGFQDKDLIKRLKDKKIVCYGAGLGFRTFNSLVVKQFGLNLIAIIDKKFPEIAIIGPYPVYNTESFPGSLIDKDTVAVITVTRPEYECEILDYLKYRGFTNILRAKDIYEFNVPIMPNDVKRKGFDYYLENREKVLAAMKLFNDELSKRIYYKFLKTHMLKVPQEIPCSVSTDQYFPKNVELAKGKRRIIHCGAYVGDTIKDMINFLGKIEALACFEPDPKNFAELREFVQKNHSEIADMVLLFPCAVSSGEELVSFRSLGAESFITKGERGDFFIQTVALDNVLFGFKPSYITLDVEGHELEALKGAKRIIEEDRPDLAVCVYHSPCDIWEIPLYIEEQDLGYKLFLRNHRGFCMETVLYATAGS